jgi:hypothetical protein
MPADPTQLPRAGDASITRSDRDALSRYDRARVKARRDDAEAYGAHLLPQLAKQYSFDSDATWKAATERSQAAVRAAEREPAERCGELHIPSWGRPNLFVSWHSRGENASKKRRHELRRVARSRAAALVKQAKSQIERDSIDFQSRLLPDHSRHARPKPCLIPCRLSNR